MDVPTNLWEHQMAIPYWLFAQIGRNILLSTILHSVGTVQIQTYTATITLFNLD